MVASNAELSADAALRTPTVKVWDPFVRIVHWSLVTLFAVAFVTGDDAERIHIWAGYGVGGLVALRVVWGLIGPRYARFASFMTGPRGVVTYLRRSLHLEAPRHLGHNPAGGAMILALLFMLACICVTGITLTTIAYQHSRFLKEGHELLANLTLALIIVHVLGVIAASYIHGENLVAAMITGRKRAERRRCPAGAGPLTGHRGEAP
jgi:cytochrome b